MSTLHQYLLAIGCFQGIMFFLLLVFDARMTLASKILGLYCLMLGLFFITPFITTGIAPAYLYPLAAWLFFLPLTFGSMIYLYCRKVVFDEPYKNTDWLHFLPLLICYVLNADALFLYHEEFRLWIIGGQAPTLRVWLSEYVLFVVAFFYIVTTAFVVKNYQKRALNTLSNFNPAVFKWLGLLIVVNIIAWVGKAITSFTDFRVAAVVVLSDAIILILIYLIALTQWRNPNIFTLSQTQPNTVTSQKTPIQKQSKQAGVIDVDMRKNLYQSLVDDFEKNNLYRDNQLTLTKLAQITGISTHHLSEVLNQHAGKNFNQFVNAYRVEEVCERLKSGTKENLLDLAFNAGFSSKSTFNTFFKKATGLTPTRFRQQYINLK